MAHSNHHAFRRRVIHSTCPHISMSELTTISFLAPLHHCNCSQLFSLNPKDKSQPSLFFCFHDFLIFTGITDLIFLKQPLPLNSETTQLLGFFDTVFHCSSSVSFADSPSSAHPLNLQCTSRFHLSWPSSLFYFLLNSTPCSTAIYTTGDQISPKLSPGPQNLICKDPGNISTCVSHRSLQNYV